MQGCTIYVMKRVDSIGGKAQVTGIDTKYVKEQIAVELGADMYLLVSPYKEINKEPLWKRARRKLLIWEANARLWITSRAELGQSDIRTRTPAPVTDAEFHAPLMSSSEPPQNKLESTQTTTNALPGSKGAGTYLKELHSTPDMWWPCKKCRETVFMGFCDVCKVVTEF